MQQVTYVVFMKNLVSGEHFAVPHNAPPAAHDAAMEALRHRYPANKFMTLTAYTLAELEDTCEHVRRWPGVATKPQATARPTTTTATHVTSPTPSAEAMAMVAQLAAGQPSVRTEAEPPATSSIFQAGSMLKQAQMAATQVSTPPTETYPKADPAPAFKAEAVSQRQQAIPQTGLQGGLSVIQALKQLRQ